MIRAGAVIRQLDTPSNISVFQETEISQSRRKVFFLIPKKDEFKMRLGNSWDRICLLTVQ